MMRVSTELQQVLLQVTHQSLLRSTQIFIEADRLWKEQRADMMPRWSSFLRSSCFNKQWNGKMHDDPTFFK